MDSKYEELEKWKKLKDSGDITEEEYNTEKQRLLNTEQNIKTKQKYKISYLMIIVIILNIILLIANFFLRIDNIGEKEYIISQGDYKDKFTFKINELVISKGINQLKREGFYVSEDMYLVYEHKNAKQYLVLAYYNSNNKDTSLYYIKGIDAKTGEVKTIEFANRSYGKDYIISKALSSKNLESGYIGSFKFKVDYNDGYKEPSLKSTNSSQFYFSLAICIIIICAIIYFAYKRTKRISTIVNIIGIAVLLIQLLFIVLPK